MGQWDGGQAKDELKSVIEWSEKAVSLASTLICIEEMLLTSAMQTITCRGADEQSRLGWPVNPISSALAQFIKKGLWSVQAEMNSS